MTSAPSQSNDRSWAHFGVLLGWLLASASTACRKEVVATLVLSFVGTILQATAFVALAAYVDAAQSDWRIDLAGDLSIPVTDTVGGLLAFSLILMGALALSALCFYVARLIAIRAALSYEKISAKRAAYMLAVRRSGADGSAGPLPDDKTLQTFMTRGPRYLGRALIELLNATTPIVTAILALALLLYWEPLFTLAMLVAMGISAPFHLLVIRKGMTSGRDLTKYARKDVLAKVDILNALRKRPYPQDDDADWIDGILAAEDSRRYLTSYSIRLRIAHMSILVSSMTVAFIVFGLALYFGNVLVKQERGIGHLLLYLVALKYFLGGLSSAFKGFTTINILFVYFEQYLAIVGTQPLQRPARPRSAAGGPADLGLPADGGVLPLAPNSVLTLFCNPPLSWLRLPAILGAVYGHDEARATPALAASAIAAMDYPAVSDDLGECLNLPPDFDLDHFIEQWPFLSDRLETFRSIPTDSWRAADWPALGYDLKFIFAVAAAVRRPETRLLFLDEIGMRQLKAPEIKALLQSLNNRIVVLCYSAVPLVLTHVKSGVFGVVRDGEIVYTGRCEEFQDRRLDVIDAVEGTEPQTAVLDGPLPDELDL